MPIYAFECSACGHDFERLQKLSDVDPTECPKCGAAQIRRQLTAPQFRLAGGGWYETDFKKDGDRKRNLAGESGAPKESGGGSDTTSDGKTGASKPATAGTSGAPAPASATGPSGSSSSTPPSPSSAGGSGSSGSSGAKGAPPRP